MQEEVDEKTVTLIINGGKISANILKTVLLKLIQQIDEKNRIVEAERREQQKIKAAKKEANPALESAEGRAAETSSKEEISQSADLREDPADREAESPKEAVSEKDNGREPDQKTSREGHEKAGHDRGGREEKHGRERKSILSRLNEKKQQVMSQPQRNVPARTKNAEL